MLGEEHPVYDNPCVPIVVSEKVYLVIGQFILSLDVNIESSITVIAVPPDPLNDLKKTKSLMKLLSIFI